MPPGVRICGPGHANYIQLSPAGAVILPFLSRPTLRSLIVRTAGASPRAVQPWRSWRNEAAKGKLSKLRCVGVCRPRGVLWEVLSCLFEAPPPPQHTYFVRRCVNGWTPLHHRQPPLMTWQLPPVDTSKFTHFSTGYLDTNYFINSPVGKLVTLRKHGGNGT